MSIEFSLPHESDSEKFRYEGAISPKHTLQHGFRKAPAAIILQDMPRVEYYFTTTRSHMRLCRYRNPHQLQSTRSSLQETSVSCGS